jgi:hypothetical protein
VNRLDFQRLHAVGKIVNLGCGDDPAEFGPRATHVDVDEWDLPNFVRANVEALPFADREYDTAILGDVLEHCAIPTIAVAEACRVARRVVITVPEELALPSVGQHFELGLKQRADHYREHHGWWGNGMNDEEVVVAHKRTDPRFKGSPDSEADVPHDGHVNRFDEEWIDRLLELPVIMGKKVVHRSKEPEGSWHNWLILLEDA